MKLNDQKAIAKAGEDPAANIRPVARQVEGMFVQMMLKSMRDALPKDGLFSSEHTRLYTSMYDQQIAQQMTAGKGLGLAEMMVKQMTPEQPLPEESTPAAPMKFPLETVVRYQNQALSQLVQKAVPRNYDDSLPGDSKAFLAQLSLPAQLASQQSGVPHHLIVRRHWNLVGNGKSAAKTASRAITCLVSKPLATGKGQLLKSPRLNMKTAKRRK